MFAIKNRTKVDRCGQNRTLRQLWSLLVPRISCKWSKNGLDQLILKVSVDWLS